MTPEQLVLVETVIAQVGTHPEFAERFYVRLFTVAPQTAAMFGDLDAQQRKLTDELAAMVSMLRDIDSLDERARVLGERHRGYGVVAAHYRIAREVMADTLREVLGDDFGPDEEAAWNRATSLIAELMMSG